MHIYEETFLYKYVKHVSYETKLIHVYVHVHMCVYMYIHTDTEALIVEAIIRFCFY